MHRIDSTGRKRLPSSFPEVAGGRCPAEESCAARQWLMAPESAAVKHQRYKQQHIPMVRMVKAASRIEICRDVSR